MHLQTHLQKQARRYRLITRAFLKTLTTGNLEWAVCFVRWRSCSFHWHTRLTNMSKKTLSHRKRKTKGPQIFFSIVFFPSNPIHFSFVDSCSGQKPRKIWLIPIPCFTFWINITSGIFSYVLFFFFFWLGEELDNLYAAFLVKTWGAKNTALVST